MARAKFFSSSSPILLIHLHTHDQASWWLLNAAGHILEHANQVPLEAIPAQKQRPVWVLIPTTEITLIQAYVPTKQRQRMRQAIPYALEEQLAEDVDGLHFALGKRTGPTGEIAVAVVARTRMAAYLQALKTVGISPTGLLPDVLAVPLTDGWSVVLSAETALVRTGSQSGFAIEKASLDVALPLALTETEYPPTQITVFQDNETPTTLTALHALGIPLVEKQVEMTWAWLAQGRMGDKPIINLLQDDYALSNQITPIAWRSWRLTAALLLLLGGLYMTKQWLAYQQIKQLQPVLTAQIERVYRETFPQARKIVNPRVQMAQHLKTLYAQQDKPAQEHFLSLLAQISPPLKRISNLHIKRLDYHQGHLEIQLVVNNFETLEQLKQHLDEKNFNVQIKEATRRQAEIEGVLQIEKRSSP